jgi:glycerol-3-phosphate dehydrogenase
MAGCNVEGSFLAGQLCGDLDVPYKQTGSLVLAFCDADIPMLRELYERGIKME